MATRDEINAFLSGGSKAFPFNAVGDSVSGEIVDMDLRQQTHMETGEPLVWRDGSPRMVLVITLQTTLAENENDDGTRAVWARGGNFTPVSGTGTSSLTAIKDALRTSGAKDLDIGGWLTVTYTGTGQSSSRGLTPPKLYTATYKAPTKSVSLDELT